MLQRVIIYIFILFLTFTTSAVAKEITIRDRKDGSQIAIIHTVESGRHEYIAIGELVKAFGLSYKVDPLKKQLTIRSPKGQIKLYAFNPFVIIDDSVRQLPVAILHYHGVFYAPFAYFIFTIKPSLPFEFEYDTAQNILWIIRPHAKLQAITIQDKQNGSLIRISIDQPVKPANIFTSESNGWLYIDIYGARSHHFSNSAVVKQTSIIDKVTIIDLSNDAVRIGFALLKKVKEKKVEVRQNPSEILLALRTHDEIPPALLAQLEREREKWRFDVIVIDPGHGGKDPGAISRTGLREKDVTLKIAKEIKRILEKELKVKVILTRETDEFIPLQKRTEIANQAKGKLFLSIHADSNPNRSLRGHTVYFMGPAKTEEARRVAQFENSVIKFEDSQEKYANLSDAAFILAANAQNSFNKESEDLAAMLEKSLRERTGLDGLGVRQAGFYVLYGASMPNILLETAFLSNYNDESLLKTASYQRLIAEAVCQSIREFKDRYESLF